MNLVCVSCGGGGGAKKLPPHPYVSGSVTGTEGRGGTLPFSLKLQPRIKCLVFQRGKPNVRRTW